MWNCKISIIVPVYNMEQYLKKCVDSIIKQTYSNLEIILVNDGSLDKSLFICKEYKKRDSRIRIVNKKNGGLSSARNAGVNVATGEYITFVDSDDYLKGNAIETLVKMIEHSQADIAYIHDIIVNEHYSIIGKEELDHCEKMYTSSTFLKAICERRVSCSVCGKLFKKNLFLDVRFNEQKLNEDFLLLSELLLQKNIRIIEDTFAGYYYFERSNSISRGGFGKSLRDAVFNTEEMKWLANKKDKNLVPYFGAFALYQARTALVIMTDDEYKIEKEFVASCRKIIKENLQYAEHSFVTTKDIVFCKVFLLFPEVAIKVVRYIRSKK